MKKEVRIYLEGGGTSSNGRQLLRTGFDDFLEEIKNAARKRRIKWKTVPCGSREDAYRNFRFALEDHPQALNLLVVDSETPVSSGPQRHLINHDGWQQLQDVKPEQCHLMVQVMESWIIADKKALSNYYGQRFRPNQIPNTKNVEKLPKSRVYSALQNASAKTKKGRYHKLQHASDLLKRIDPQSVRQVASHCERFLDCLEKFVGV